MQTLFQCLLRNLDIGNIDWWDLGYSFSIAFAFVDSVLEILVRGEKNQSSATIVAMCRAKLNVKPSHIVRAAVSTHRQTVYHILRSAVLLCATFQACQHAACASFFRLTASPSRRLQNMPTIYSRILHSRSTTRFPRYDTLAET
ncbi:hypothetical protein OCU04_007616 [Sclerotinia nivalis]|uniref:Uncharacterized protein n=1 Tax=Sclerotinia nivalis TaxID=352851 RepID=A0A9X0DI41_9HELO|nr:hypothetical protein OCU04_007616 [Sclerotinia nivalis]